MTIVPRFLRRLARDQRGAVAVTLALSLIPLSLAALGAVDLTRAVSARAQLQDALDAATLAAVRTAAATSNPPSDADKAKLQAAGEASWAQNLKTSPDFTVKSTIFTYAAGSPSVVQGDATAALNGLFVQALLGGTPLTVKAHSEVTASSKNVEVALVLDITGSMNQHGKIDALKTSAKDLVNLVVKTQQSPYYSRVAIIPYAAAVNVGSGEAHKFRGPTDATCADGVGGCDVINFIPYKGGAKQSFNISTDCVTERIAAKPNDSAPVANNWVGWKYLPTNPLNSGCPSSSVEYLTDNKASLLSTIDGLRANYSTAGHIGLAWGWYAISPNFISNFVSGKQIPGPYSDVVKQKTLKVVVLMTDGMFNTAYCQGVVSGPSSDSGSGADNEKINCKQNGDSFSQAKALCDTIKQNGIIIYTVGLDLQDDDVDPQAAVSLMNYCATDAGHVYLPGNGADLQTAFHAIAEDINSLRLSR